MPHGYPDWTGKTSSASNFGMNDNAELAARLGSVVNYDRLGDVVYATDFREGKGQLFWVEPVGGASLEWGIGTGLFGATYLYMSGSSSTGNPVDILRYNYTPPDNRIGVELSVGALANVEKVGIGIVYQNPTDSYRFLCYLDVFTRQLFYRDNTGADVQFGTLDSYIFNSGAWNILKLVVDESYLTYARFSVNYKSFDLSDIEPESIGGGWTGGNAQFLEVYPLSGVTFNLSIGHFILTQNEP